MGKDTIVIKKRGEDGSKIITARIKEDVLKALDDIAAGSNCSRNELINIILLNTFLKIMDTLKRFNIRGIWMDTEKFGIS